MATPARLRLPLETDADAIVSSVRASLTELAPWMPWATDDYGMDSALGWIRGEFGDAHRFVIVDEAGGHLGNVGLNDLDALNRRANLGYWVRSDRAGRGIATEAVRQLVTFAFAETDLERLEVVVSVENVASLRVAEKAGARDEGVALARIRLQGRQHDARVFSFTRS